MVTTRQPLAEVMDLVESRAALGRTDAGRSLTAADVVRGASSLTARRGALEDALRATARPGASVDSIVDRIERDPALCAHVLLAASQQAGGAAIPSLSSAARGLHPLALRQALHDAGDGADSAPLDSARKEMVSIAATARVLARYVDDLSVEQAFIAGMFSLLGRFCMRQCAPDAADAIAVEAARQGVPLQTAEWRWLGFSHAEVGVVVGARFKLPVHVLHAIRFQHHLDASLSSVRAGAREQWMVAVVVMAKDIVTALFAGAPLTGRQLASHPAQQLLALPRAVLDDVSEEAKLAAFGLGAVLPA